MISSFAIGLFVGLFLGLIIVLIVTELLERMEKNNKQKEQRMIKILTDELNKRRFPPRT